MFSFSVILNTLANASGTQGSPWGSLIFMLILMVGVIVLMIVPQKKNEKKARQMLDSLKVGTKIRTIGGIYGTIVSVKEDLITIVSGPDEVKLVFVKGAVASIITDEEMSAAENTDDEQTIKLEDNE